MNKCKLIAVAALLLVSGCSAIPPKLGVNNGQLTPCPEKPNCVSSLSSDKDQYIEPIQHSATQLEIKNAILTVLKAMPNSKVIASDMNYVRAEFTSKVLRFVDDVEFYFPETGTVQSTIHIRSASRVGYSDFGVNRARIEQFQKQFKTIRI